MLHYHYASLEFINAKLRKFEGLIQNCYEKKGSSDPVDEMKEKEH